MRMKLIIRYIGWINLAISITLFISFFIHWVLFEPNRPLGENMVREEIIIFKDILYFKPITLASLTGILGYILLLESIEGPLKQVTHISVLRISRIIAFTSLGIFLYEYLFNLMYWAALIIKGGYSNIDLIYTKFPYTRYSWNIVYATKLFLMGLILSIITIFYTYKLERNHLMGN